MLAVGEIDLYKSNEISAFYCPSEKISEVAANQVATFTL